MPNASTRWTTCAAQPGIALRWSRSGSGERSCTLSPMRAHRPEQILKLGFMDARERVTGRVPYTINVELPGMLHAKILRSESPHARLTRVDASRARELPGVV